MNDHVASSVLCSGPSSGLLPGPEDRKGHKSQNGVCPQARPDHGAGKRGRLPGPRVLLCELGRRVAASHQLCRSQVLTGVVIVLACDQRHSADSSSGLRFPWGGLCEGMGTCSPTWLPKDILSQLRVRSAGAPSSLRAGPLWSTGLRFVPR